MDAIWDFVAVVLASVDLALVTGLWPHCPCEVQGQGASQDHKCVGVGLYLGRSLGVTSRLQRPAEASWLQRKDLSNTMQSVDR